MMGDSMILQFAPFSSAVDAGFWHKFTEHKLDVLHLSQEPVNLVGTYVNSDASGLPTRLSVEYDALDSNRKAAPWTCNASGTLLNTNTIEEFRNRDKIEMLKSSATVIWDAVISGKAVENPSVLASFLMFTFADLKKYHYYYWFAFPAFTLPKTIPVVQQPQPLSNQITESQVTSLLDAYSGQETIVNQGFYVITRKADEFAFHPLSDYAKLRETTANNDTEVFLGFTDPCTLPQNPGWPLRNLLTLVALKWSKQWPLHKIICLRVRTRSGVKDASHSIVVEVDLGGALDPNQCPETLPQCLGWEKNERGKMGPRMVNLSSSMDPARLAESAVDLNLKLMRWRVAPQLDLNIIKNTRCLLLGAGTLGCAVARCLLGWGVRGITFVDNGKVSFSNPVRQNLFTFSTCLNGGQHKAVAAAQSLTDIFPKVLSNGVVLNIPMPGHTVGESLIEQVKQDVAALEELIDDHDALFLLMDSRESRWLPTVLGAAKHKLVFTAALGFDSYLVMRHGYRGDEAHSASGSSSQAEGPEPALTGKPIPGHLLGCYFCNDVVAPGDSTQDRTLDQQCTVTRPGVSYLASAHIVELMVSLLQHPDKGLAEAQICQDQDAKEGVLGTVPHSLRGFLGRQQHLPLATSRFQQCPACGDKIIAAYKDEGFEFLLKVFNSPSYLEEVSGLNQLQQCAVESQVIMPWHNQDELIVYESGS